MTKKVQGRMIKKKISPLAIILIVVLTIILAYWGWHTFTDQEELAVVVTEQEPVAEQITDPEVVKPDIAIVQPLIKDAEQVVLDIEKQAVQDPMAAACRELIKQITLFFEHLDQQQYIAVRELKGGSLNHFTKLADKLLASPPVVTSETANLFTILNNMTHFYRILQKDNLFLIKDILRHEADNIEIIMASFYQWSKIGEKCGDQIIKIKLPLEDIYEYAGFFLNTLGGKSYLFRRDSRVRMLTSYYAILTLDRANNAGLNKYGIDIRPAINALLEELKVSRQLTNRDHYISTLLTLQTKYRLKYGDGRVLLPTE